MVTSPSPFSTVGIRNHADESFVRKCPFGERNIGNGNFGVLFDIFFIVFHKIKL